MLKNIDKGIDLNKDRTTALSKGLVDIIKNYWPEKINTVVTVKS